MYSSELQRQLISNTFFSFMIFELTIFIMLLVDFRCINFTTGTFNRTKLHWVFRRTYVDIQLDGSRDYNST